MVDTRGGEEVPTVVEVGESTNAGPIEPTRVRRFVDANGRTERIGAFEILGELGRGGMGVVYEVRDRRNGEILALKTIERERLELADNNAEQRLFQEISLLSRLIYPGVVRLKQFGFADQPSGESTAYFVMERLHGRTLRSYLDAKERFDVVEACRIIASITETLIFLEANGVLHRDIKPANLLVDTVGRVVLMDFGIGRSSDLTRLTAAGQVVGTVSYMAPERLRGEPGDIRSDIYALGVVLYQVLTADLPFPGAEPVDIMAGIEKGVRWPRDITLLEGAQEVMALAEAMLAPQTAQRPTPQDVLSACRPFLARSVARPVSPAGFGTFRPAAQLQSRGSWGVLVFVIAIVSLAFAGGFAIGMRRDPPPRLADATRPKMPLEARPVVIPKQRTTPEFADAESAFDYGDRALREGRLRAAIVALNHALKLNPALAEAHRRLGDAHLSNDDITAATKSYKIYVALRPNAADAPRVRALLAKVEG